MKKLSNIIIGWWFFLTNQNSITARKRLKICSTCEFRKWFICGECFCPLNAKARSDDDCPKGKWPKLQEPKSMPDLTVSYNDTIKYLDNHIK